MDQKNNIHPREDIGHPYSINNENRFLTIFDFVIIREEENPNLKKVGKIIELFFGNDFITQNI